MFASTSIHDVTEVRLEHSSEIDNGPHQLSCGTWVLNLRIRCGESSHTIDLYSRDKSVLDAVTIVNPDDPLQLEIPELPDDSLQSAKDAAIKALQAYVNHPDCRIHASDAKAINRVYGMLQD